MLEARERPTGISSLSPSWVTEMKLRPREEESCVLGHWHQIWPDNPGLLVPVSLCLLSPDLLGKIEKARWCSNHEHKSQSQPGINYNPGNSFLKSMILDRMFLKTQVSNLFNGVH